MQRAAPEVRKTETKLPEREAARSEAVSRGTGFDSEWSAAQSLASATRFGHRLENLAPPSSPVAAAPIQRLSTWRKRLYGGLGTIAGLGATVGGGLLAAGAATATAATAPPSGPESSGRAWSRGDFTGPTGG